MANKILLTGANGTVGRLLNLHLAPWHTVTALQGSADLDLLDRDATNKFFLDKHFDCVIHCAAVGTNDTNNSNSLIAQNNLTMWDNLRDHQHKFNRLINIASGCELCYGPERAEWELFDQLPTSAYGLSKNLIARDVLTAPGWYNLRLFGLIANTRVFKALWDAVDAGKQVFDVVNDKYMDYISEDDLARIVRHYVEAKITLPQDINMVYDTKYRVSEVLQRYIDDNGIDIKLNIINTVTSEFDYTGSGHKLAQMGIL
jgi:nucleoside-diphosphate-sugar epimerase